MVGLNSYGSEGEYISKTTTGYNRMPNGNGRLNGHAINILIATIQVIVTLSGAGMFIRSIEKSFDERLSKLEQKLNEHAIVAKKNTTSINFHHTLGVTCSKGCHIERHTNFEYTPEKR